MGRPRQIGKFKPPSFSNSEFTRCVPYKALEL